MHDHRIVCGTDVRRYGMGPEDASRADVLVARHGGSVELFGGGAGCAVRWTLGEVSVTASGVTYAEALTNLNRGIA
jgi:hypothetical protein